MRSNIGANAAKLSSTWERSPPRRPSPNSKTKPNTFAQSVQAGVEHCRVPKLEANGHRNSASTGLNPQDDSPQRIQTGSAAHCPACVPQTTADNAANRWPSSCDTSPCSLPTSRCGAHSPSRPESMPPDHVSQPRNTPTPAIHRITLHPNPLRSLKTCLLQQLLKMTMIDVINQEVFKILSTQQHRRATGLTGLLTHDH